MSNGDDLTYENETKKIKADKKEANTLMSKRVGIPNCWYEAQIKDLKKEIDRLSEENSNFKIISASHKELNSKLQIQLNILEKENKLLKNKVDDPLSILKKAGF